MSGFAKLWLRPLTRSVSNPAFPRKETLETLLLVIRQQPKLSKEASSALISIGQAIHETTTDNELSVLLRGTLNQEVYVRNSCLQTLQVCSLPLSMGSMTHATQPFDLTDLDWSAELWIACHDNDEQNARLANHIWEDNGLDVPETYLNDLAPFLGMIHVDIHRSSTHFLQNTRIRMLETALLLLLQTLPSTGPRRWVQLFRR